jgi:Na+-translocating ferredoxin:NAD+ oxidoreductase RnfG subunit
MLRSFSCAGILSLTVIFTIRFSFAGDIEQASNVVRRVFPGTNQVRTVTIHFTKADLDSLHKVLRQQWPGDSITILVPEGTSAFAVVDNVRGKSQMITYVLAVSGALVVQDLEILAYREAYGGEIRNASWRRQFQGKTPVDPLRAGRDIKNITGATISVRAVTEGVKRILATLPLIAERIEYRRSR